MKPAARLATSILLLLFLTVFLLPLQAEEKSTAVRIYLRRGDDARKIAESLIEKLNQHPCSKLMAERVFKENKTPFVFHLKIDRTSRFFWGKYYVEIWSDECEEPIK